MREVAGKPLIAHSIRAAQAARRVDRVVVSTDDEDIAAVSRAWGAQVVMRPPALATDIASSESALLHALRVLEAEDAYVPDLLVFLQCTSPLTTSVDIDGTVEALGASGADSAVAVTDFHYFVWGRDVDGAGRGINHDPAIRQRRQDREPQFLETGAVYVMKVPGFLESEHRFFGRTALYEMPAERVLEIDDPLDLELARARLASVGKVKRGRALPDPVAAVIMDFDGVFTDNRVYTDENGLESVVCSRADGMGLEQLRKAGIPLLVISKEVNPVVAARCRKLGIECHHGIEGKLALMRKICEERGYGLAHVVFVGNDVNDLECIRAAGCGVAVADAHPRALADADLVLASRGGEGALRELSELILDIEKEDP